MDIFLLPARLIFAEDAVLLSLRGRRVVVVCVLEFAGRGISTSKLIVSSFLCCYSSGSVWETAAELLMTKTSKMFSLFVARTDDNELNKIKWLSKNFTCSKAARTNILFCYCLRAWGDIFLLVAILLSPKAHRNESVLLLCERRVVVVSDRRSGRLWGCDLENQ